MFEIFDVAAGTFLAPGKSAGGLAMTNDLDVLEVRVTNWMAATGIRLGQREDAHALGTNHPPRTVVLVSGRAPQAQSLDDLLVAASDYDVIAVESISQSYSCITRVKPDLVIISSDVDEVASCHLLSMLRADARSSGIPVLTCPTFRSHRALDDDLAEQDQDMSAPSLAARMN